MRNSRIRKISKNSTRIKSRYSSHEEVNVNYRRNIFITIFFILIISIGYVLFYNDYFTLDESTITGITIADKDLFNNKVREYLDGKKYLIFSNSNFFVFDVFELKEMLMRGFSFSDVTVKKVFPDRLDIIVDEYIPVVIYTDTSVYVYQSIDGATVKKLRLVQDGEWSYDKMVVATGTVHLIDKEDSKIFKPDINGLKAQYGEFPILVVREYNIYNPNYINITVSWEKILTSIGFKPSYYEVINDGVDLIIRFANQKFYILTSFTNDPALANKALATLLKDKVIDINSLQYLDLRFEDRVYWQ